jgi:hypothetical protein
MQRSFGRSATRKSASNILKTHCNHVSCLARCRANAVLQVLSHYRDKQLEEDGSGQRISNFFVVQEAPTSRAGSAALEKVHGKWDPHVDADTQGAANWPVLDYGPGRSRSGACMGVCCCSNCATAFLMQGLQKAREFLVNEC